jgi:hypothetical protein
MFPAFSSHSSPLKILLTKLFALLILPLKDRFVFCRSPREMIMDPEGPREETNGDFLEKGGDEIVF